MGLDATVGWCVAVEEADGVLGAGWMAAGPCCCLKMGSYPRHSRFDFLQLLQVGWASSHWVAGSC